MAVRWREVMDVRWVAGGVLLSIALRLRMVFTPMTTDEGGYLAIARAWRHGAVLYRDVWVDRPQGLLLGYRLLDSATGGSTAWVRLMAIAAGAVVVASTAMIVGLVAGRAAGGFAAVLCACLTANPMVEGHTANAELLSAAPAALGLAVGLWVVLGGVNERWLVVSGLVGGLALSVKQSGFDGLVVLGLVVVVLAVTRRTSWRDAARRLGLIVGGVCVVLVALVVHGAATGWSRWWYAMAGYRLEARSVGRGAEWNRLDASLGRVWTVLAPALVVLLAGFLLIEMRRRRVALDSRLLLAAWLGVATVSFLLGGQFYPHYFVLLGPPLAAAAAAVVVRLPRRRLRAAALVLLVVPGLVRSADILSMERGAAATASTTDTRLATNERVADWFDEHREPGDAIYAMCASAAMYAAADVDPPYPYLWWDGVVQIPGALPMLRAWLASAAAPEFVAVYLNVASCDPTGALQRVLDERYHRVALIDAVPILELQPVR